MKARFLLYFAWVGVLIGCLLSFYLGEILGHEPCRLCWYQRMTLFPLVIILGVALYREDPNVFPYAAPFVVLGVGAALLHLFHVPFCSPVVPCTLTAVPIIGIPFPVLSLIGFLVIGALLFLAHKASVK